MASRLNRKNDLGEDSWAGTPSICPEMRSYPSLFTPLLAKSHIVLRKTDVFVAPASISHGTLLEENPDMLSKSVWLLNEEPPSTSSLSTHFGLNPLDMLKSCREQKGLTHRTLYATVPPPPRQRFSVRHGSLSNLPSLLEVVKHIRNSLFYTRLPYFHSSAVKKLK